MALLRLLGYCLLLLVALEHVVITPTRASEGDRDFAFQTCLYACTGAGCPGLSDRMWLVFPGWTCEQECQYMCMWEREEARRKHNLPARQYYGKWPFRRILGIQEPFSTLFSILNGLPHIYVAWKLLKEVAPKQLPLAMRAVIILGCYMSINTWLWSTAFHARETWWTERLDYHFATFHMVYYGIYAVTRATLEWAPHRLTEAAVIISVLFTMLFLAHVWYMNAISFDYGWNMQLTGLFTVFQAVVWLAWAVGVIMREKKSIPTSKRRKAPRMVIRFQALIFSFAAFELFDFPPIADLLDAHAIWHGLTVPLVVYWYKFRMQDAKEAVQISNSFNV